MGMIKHFVHNTTGSIAVSFAVASVGLMLAAGCAVDFARYYRAETELQSVADAAALSAGASSATTSSSMKAIAAKFIQGNAAILSAENVQTTAFDFDDNSKRLSLTLEGEVPMAFMSLVGIYKLDAKASSTVKSRSAPPVEAVMVLDTTYSMVGSKIDTLKVAAKNLAKSILANPQARVGIVPFASYVNVGVSRRGEDGLDVPSDSSSTGKSCSTTYPNAQNCTTVKTTSTCSSTNDGITTTYACSSSKTTCETWGSPVKVCTSSTSTTKFYGCVGSRAEPYRSVIASTGNKYPGLMNTTCAKEIMDLNASEKTATSTIDALSVSGETYLPAGVTWGWNMLTPEAPLRSALSKADLKAKGGKKVLVIMTDGTNTLAPTTTAAGPHGAMTTGPYKNTPYANTLTAQLCQNIKDDQIDVYTVLFDVADPTIEALLQNCATDPSKSYVAKNANELIAAFDGIAKQLAQVRIVY